MAHLDEVIVKVDDALAEGVIAHMNELLIALSDGITASGRPDAGELKRT